jgi:type I restriction enzyme M protein
VENRYNFPFSFYVEQEDTREKIDIVKLNVQIKEIVAMEKNLGWR